VLVWFGLVLQACVEYGFFYVVNHGAEGLVEKVFAESSKFFEQPLGEKMALLRNRNYLGYTPLGADKLDASSKFKGLRLMFHSQFFA
jgi:isopenicillin N synthase-like dioxygenase